jgi:hypothetical protein
VEETNGQVPGPGGSGYAGWILVRHKSRSGGPTVNTDRPPATGAHTMTISDNTDGAAGTATVGSMGCITSRSNLERIAEREPSFFSSVKLR